MSEPTTEAGRMLLDDLLPAGWDDGHRTSMAGRIIAIEDEAREQPCSKMRPVGAIDRLLETIEEGADERPKR